MTIRSSAAVTAINSIREDQSDKHYSILYHEAIYMWYMCDLEPLNSLRDEGFWKELKKKMNHPQEKE